MNATSINHSIVTLCATEPQVAQQAPSKKEPFWQPNTWDKNVCLPMCRSDRQDFQKHPQGFEPRFFPYNPLKYMKVAKPSGEPPFWRLWALRCFHVNTCWRVDTRLLCLSNTIFSTFPGPYMCSIRVIQTNPLTVTTQSNKIIHVIFTGISHKQCFHFIPTKNADRIIES